VVCKASQSNQITACKVGDGQRIAVAAVGEHELALVVGTPQLIGLGRARERGALGPVASSGSAFDQAMAIEHRVHRTDRGRVHIRIEPGQSFPDLRGSPTRLVLLQAYDQRLDLDGQLVGVPVRPPRTIGQSLKTDIVVAIEDLVAGLARDVEVSADSGHLLAVQEPGNELKPFIHRFTHLPGHFALPAKGPIV